MEPKTFISTAAIDGRFYGEDVSTIRQFYSLQSASGSPILCTRGGKRTVAFDTGVAQLIQIDQQPEVPWFAQAVLHEGRAVIKYTPLTALTAADGEPVPQLAQVPAIQVERAKGQAETARRNTPKL